METNKQDAPQAPVIPESELKLPEESLNGAVQSPVTSARIVNPLLIVLLVVLLAVLAVVVIWGEQIIDIVMPATVSDTTMEMMPPTEEQATTSVETNAEMEVVEMEAELNDSELEEFDAEMEAIEAEIEAELGT